MKWIPQAEEPEIYGAFWELALLFPCIPFQRFPILVLAGWPGLSAYVGRLDGHLSIGCPATAAWIRITSPSSHLPRCARHKRWGPSWKQAWGWWPKVLWEGSVGWFCSVPIAKGIKSGPDVLGDFPGRFVINSSIGFFPWCNKSPNFHIYFCLTETNSTCDWGQT